MRRILFVVSFCVISFAYSTSVANAQGDDFDLDVQDSSVTVDANGYYYPRTDSPTAMRRCGVDEASIKAQGFMIPVTLTAPLTVSNMQYCNSKTKRVGQTNRLGKRYGNRQIVLGPGTVIWVDPKQPGVAVAGGCLNKFNANIPMPTPAVTTTQPTPTPRVIEKPCEPHEMRTQDIIENGVKIGVRKYDGCKEWNDISRTQFVNPCPIVTAAEWGSKGWGSRTPSLAEWILGPVKAVAIAGLGSNTDRKKAMIISGVSSTADTMVVSYIYPDYNYLELQTSVGPMSVRKGKNPFSYGNGELVLEWKDNNQINLTSKKAGICAFGIVQQGVQFGSDAIVFRKSDGEQQVVPIKPKDQTAPPNRTGTGGTSGTRIPGNGVPAGTIISDDRRRDPRSGVNQFVDGNYSPSTSTASQPIFRPTPQTQNNAGSIPAFCNEPGAICRPLVQADGTEKWQRVN